MYSPVQGQRGWQCAFWMWGLWVGEKLSALIPIPSSPQGRPHPPPAHLQAGKVSLCTERLFQLHGPQRLLQRLRGAPSNYTFIFLGVVSVRGSITHKSAKGSFLASHWQTLIGERGFAPCKRRFISNFILERKDRARSYNIIPRGSVEYGSSNDWSTPKQWNSQGFIYSLRLNEPLKKFTLSCFVRVQLYFTWGQSTLRTKVFFSPLSEESCLPFPLSSNYQNVPLFDLTSCGHRPA